MRNGAMNNTQAIQYLGALSLCLMIKKYTMNHTQRKKSAMKNIRNILS